MWLGSGHQLKHVDLKDIPLLSTTGKLVIESARDLGVILDSRLTLSAHVSALCRAGYYRLRQLRPLVQSMTVEAARTAAAAFISCRLDYCNSLLFGLPDTLLRKLQSMQNATARLITGTRRLIISRQYYVNCTGYPSETASSSKWHAWFASRCLGRRVSTWQMTAVLFPTVPNPHCGQRTFRLA